MSQNKTTRKSAGAPAPRAYHYDSLRLLDEALKLRSLAARSREEYHRYVRKLAERAQCDPPLASGVSQSPGWKYNPHKSLRSARCLPQACSPGSCDG
ncbi:MAG: hypothetical protein WC378_06630 [Opitutaceae bacterium]